MVLFHVEASHKRVICFVFLCFLLFCDQTRSRLAMTRVSMVKFEFHTNSFLRQSSNTRSIYNAHALTEFRPSLAECPTPEGFNTASRIHQIYLAMFTPILPSFSVTLWTYLSELADSVLTSRLENKHKRTSSVSSNTQITPK